jgi:NAD(P)-dependent dehydrogenase (short-subunit alcohol dehydrogenase family)
MAADRQDRRRIRRHRHLRQQRQRHQPDQFAETDMKRFDLMMGINTRGTFMVSKYCIPHLKKAENPHILMLSPPLDMKENGSSTPPPTRWRSSA